MWMIPDFQQEQPLALQIVWFKIEALDAAPEVDIFCIVIHCQHVDSREHTLNDKIVIQLR